jgi:hypothetical protein
MEVRRWVWRQGDVQRAIVEKMIFSAAFCRSDRKAWPLCDAKLLCEALVAPKRHVYPMLSVIHVCRWCTNGCAPDGVVCRAAGGAQQAQGACRRVGVRLALPCPALT